MQPSPIRRQGHEPETNVIRLKRRFRRTTARSEQRGKRHRSKRGWNELVFVAMIAAILAAVATALILERNALSPPVSVRHRGAIFDCDAARAMGLAPARRGEPGYYPHLDADNDGIACEPWQRRWRTPSGERFDPLR